jgi:mono/diheme cytochrome c family protein
MFTKRIWFVVPVVAVSLVGCERPSKPLEFEPNRVLAYATEINSGYPMEGALNEAQVALLEHFGTPDSPKIPEALVATAPELVSLDNLKKASGPAGLFRTHCISCHGITGNGRGLNALQADVYPRDFRMGKFKFKSTPRGIKPLKADLYASIRNGIAGTAMQNIAKLTDEDVHALVDYVVYLSVRGEVERRLLSAGEEIDFENNEHLYFASSAGFEEQVQNFKDAVGEIAAGWMEAESNVRQAADPGEIPIKASLQELVAAAASAESSVLKASIERGKELFNADAASCYKCHGGNGDGSPQTLDFDEWTKDWSSNRGIDPENETGLVPLLARGALPPKKLKPRDFSQGVYRGGAEPDKLYLRIAQGIDGTAMPAAEAAVAPADIWHLVNYVRSLAKPNDELKP